VPIEAQSPIAETDTENTPVAEAQADQGELNSQKEDIVLTAAALDAQSAEPEKADDETSAEEIYELVDLLDQQNDNIIPLKAEPKPEAPEPLITADTSAAAESPAEPEIPATLEDSATPDKSVKPDEPAAKPKPSATPLQAKSDAQHQAQFDSAAETDIEFATATVELTSEEGEFGIFLDEITGPAKADATETKTEDQNRAEILKKQKAALEKAAAAKKQKLAQAKKLEAFKKQKAGQARAESSRRQKAANLKIVGLLNKYKGQNVGINYDNSADIKTAELVAANDEFFTVMVKGKKLQYSFPLHTLLSLTEGEDGVQREDFEDDTRYSAVIKVYPLILL
jgi:hypothetical protein